MNNKNTHSGRIRAAFEAVAIIFFIWFLLPLADGEANIGSITGMSVFLLLFLYVLFLGPAGRALQRLKSSVSGRILVYALTVLLLVIVLLTVILTICMVMPVFGSHDGDILIIMGCRIDEDGPGNMLMERIETAYDYMLSHPDSVCIASGGYENGYGITEAQCIRDALVEMGIESGRVYMEEKSTSTKTNIVQSTKLIKENGLPGDILIVTSGWHVYRCILLLKREGLDCGSLYAGTPLKELPSFYVRELYAILYCWFIEP